MTSAATITPARAGQPAADRGTAPFPARGQAPIDPVVSAEGLGKRFRLFARPGDRLWHWLGLARPLRRPSPTELWAVRGVNLEVRRGECLGILGANGSGKSTLLKMLSGALRPTEGRFQVRGRALSLLELGTGINPLLTGRQNVVHSANLLGFPPTYARQRMPEIEAFAELGEFFDRPVDTYSSGMRVRLMFSMFACMEPDLFIVDEALSVGDVFFQQKCVARVREMMARGMTMLFVSHDQAAVLNLCTRAILLEKGRVSFEGTPEETVARYLVGLRGGSRFAAPKTPKPAAPAADPAPARSDPAALALAADVIGPRGATRHGVGGMRVLAAAVLGPDGQPSQETTMGGVLTFRLLIEAHRPVAAPRCGVRLHDRFGTLVFGAGTYNAGLALPPLNPGDRLVADLAITMDLADGQYTFSVGCGEPAAEDPDAGVRHDTIELLGPITVLPVAGARRPFYGVARLPMRATLVAQPPIQPASQPTTSA